MPNMPVGLQWFVVGLCAVISVWTTVMNVAIFWNNFYVKRNVSWVPLVGGFFGVLALLETPIAGAHRWWWVPLIIDPGSAPGLLWTAAFFLTGRHRRITLLSGYEFFEHTADIGIRAHAETLKDLFLVMAEALVKLVAEDSQRAAVEIRSISLTAENAQDLLFSWMRELLFLFSTDRFLPATYAFEMLTPTELRATLRGRAFDPLRDTQGREVKAITRHLLRVEQRDGVWHAEVIVDV